MFMTMVHERCAPTMPPPSRQHTRRRRGSMRAIWMEGSNTNAEPGPVKRSCRFEVTRVPTSDLDFADEECVLLELRCHNGGDEGADGPCAASSSGSDKQQRRDEQGLGEPAGDSRRRRRESDAGEASGTKVAKKEAKKSKKKRKGMSVD